MEDRIEKGNVLVHNQVLHGVDTPLGLHGFRAWQQAPSKDLEKCTCGWAPQLGTHYRVKRTLLPNHSTLQRIETMIATWIDSLVQRTKEDPQPS